ncbi:MAG: hypothetical protein ACYTDY_14740 [Planctomycetota bacterium]|jgi:hypothetical protein
MFRIGFLIVLVLLSGCGSEDRLTPEQAKALIPTAAGAPESALREIAQVGAAVSPKTLPTMPLSLLLTAVRVDDSPDLRRLSDGAPAPAKVAEMWVEASTGVVTLFPADSLSDVEVRSEGDRATGSFRFRREGLVEGKVEFTAERTETVWRIVEFRLPATGDATRLQPDGTWRAEEAD